MLSSFVHLVALIVAAEMCSHRVHDDHLDCSRVQQYGGSVGQAAHKTFLGIEECKEYI
ncbi:hypothetical protein DPMN_090682 [Dreissena polymorpha]|uniref:Uncharacterized protein n=1 Tax=Dreissena polymorpha TaxID=45954 RepID=A0A9D4L075_DREPO|nr:hypothetical protein DPMN_090682 [Dreissena polymorpha]